MMSNLDEVISQESGEIESLLEKDFLNQQGAKRTRESKWIGWGEKQDEMRRSMQELFRNRLKNNIGVDKLQQLSKSLQKREKWNYIVGFDEKNPYCPPSHIPFRTRNTKQKLKADALVTNPINPQNRATFISVEDIDGAGSDGDNIKKKEVKRAYVNMSPIAQK